MQLAPLAQINLADGGDRSPSLREPQAAGELLSLIQMQHERIKVLEHDNEMLKAECRLAAAFREIMHDRMAKAEGH